MLKIKRLTPKKLNESGMRLELLNALRKAARQIKKDYEATVATWDTDVKFKEQVSLKESAPSISITTDNEVYRYVNEGTKPHIIEPVRAKRLRFQSGYNAKTTPGVLSSKNGGANGDTVFSMRVKHPGTKARKFDEAVNQKWEKQLRADLKDAMKRARQKSGHAVK